MNANPSRSTSWTNYQRALRNLERSLSDPIEKPPDRSGIVKDFEMTYELSWKVLKKILREAGHETLGAKDVYTKAFQLGYLENQEVWISMIQDRNQTSHIYSENDAQEIVERVKETYLAVFQKLETRFRSSIDPG